MRLPTRQDGVENRDKVYYKGSENEIKNLTILNCKEYKRQQLIKHQLFTADVDIKKVLNKQCFFYLTMIIFFARC